MIMSVHFDVADQIQIMYFLLIIYLGKIVKNYAVHQLRIEFKKGYTSLGGRFCVIFLMILIYP